MSFSLQLRLALGALAGICASALMAAPARSRLQALVDAAPANGIVRLPAGVYRGPLVLDRPITLVAAGDATIDGGGKFNVVTVNAPGVTLRGLVIRHSGDDPDRDNAGIVLNAPRARVEQCRLEDVLYGIYATAASDSVIRHNHIHGKALELGRRGDGLRLWECQRCLVEDNSIRDCRDVVVWYSNRVTLRGNHLQDNRYGLHFMFSDHCDVEDNRIENNSVGVYLMYSHDFTLRHNILAANRGPSGFGLGLKDVDGATAEKNLFVGNRIGIFFDDSPSRSDIHQHFENNTIAYNDIGLAFLPAVRNNEFSRNAFVDNVEQIGILGGGDFAGNAFTEAGRGNYWSDYRGFDRNRDGIGDLPYRAKGLFEDLMDRQPPLRLFLFSPAQQAVELASRAFPIFPPRLKAEDTAPLMEPQPLSFAPSPETPHADPLWLAAAGLLAGGGAVAWLAVRTLRPFAPISLSAENFAHALH